MQRVYLFLLMALTGCQLKKPMPSGDYNFIFTDGEVRMIRILDDSIYIYRCGVDRPCAEQASESYEILNKNYRSETLLYQLRTIDYASLNTQNPKDAYQIIAIHYPDSNRINYITTLRGFTKENIAETADTLNFNNYFGFTYYHQTYYNSFKKLKPIATPEDAQQLMKGTESDVYKPMLQLYDSTYKEDIYRVGINSELMTLSCIAHGYNPIGAGAAIKRLLQP